MQSAAVGESMPRRRLDMEPAAQQPLESPEPLSSAQGRSWAALETPSAPATASPAMMRARAALIAENEDVRPTTPFDIAYMTFILVNVLGSGFRYLWPLQMLLVLMTHVSLWRKVSMLSKLLSVCCRLSRSAYCKSGCGGKQTSSRPRRAWRASINAYRTSM